MTTNPNNAAQPGLSDAIAVRRALEIYAEGYDTVARVAALEGREPVVSPVSVAFDIRKNMANAVVNALSKLRAPKPLGDSCHHCGWMDWVSQDGQAYCQACGKPHGSVPAEGLPNLPELLRENADLDEAEGGNAQVCALERDAADEIERLRRGVAKLRAPVAGEATRPHLNVVLDHAADRLAEAGMREDASIVRGMKVPNDGSKTEPVKSAPQASEAVRDVNAAMAAEYQRWIDYYHQGRDYDDFLKECVHNRAALSAQPAAQKGASDA